MTDPDGADRNAQAIAEGRMPDRGGRAGRLRHLRRHPARRQGGGRAAARRRRHPGRAAAPLRLQPRQGGVLRPARASRGSPERRDGGSPTSSSSAPASAARRWRLGLAPTGRRSSSSKRGERLADGRRTATSARSSSAATFRPKETWYDGERPAVQSRQLLQCRRQLEILRRRADPLPRARISRASQHAEGVSPAWPIRL